MGETANRGRRPRRATLLALPALLFFSGCMVSTTGYQAPRGAPYPYYDHGAAGRSDSGASRDTERLRRIIVPLVQAMDRPCRVEELRVGLVRQNEINAANAGNCQFYLTTGLMQRASDDQLRGVMAHEIAHEDLGHVAKAQVLGAGINAGVALLEQWLPGSSTLTPLVGALIARSYGRSEEYAADRHAMALLSRAGYPRQVLIDTLSWMRRAGGDHGGGFLSTHPALDDRIAVLRRLS
jgi:predicted Zn-dependent protease